MSKVLMKGNEAIAEAAIRAGLGLFAGYPITPQSEILEYLSRQLPARGGVFVQTESEIAGISMAYGAAAAGVRAMTSSSGPGFSLMQEGISYIASAELPCVIVNVMRIGSGLGDIFPAQGDYWQTVKNGGHGDYRCIVYAPAGVQEAADLTYHAFDKAEEYRNPVIILSDASISQMMEPVALPEQRARDIDRYEWSLKGKGGGAFRRITSVMYYTPDYDAYIRAKYERIEAAEQRWESYETEDAQLVIAAYGIPSRICKAVVTAQRKKGRRVGLIRPVTLFPFPKQAFAALPDVRAFLAVELSPLGQFTQDVALACGMKRPLYGLYGGVKMLDEDDVAEKIEEIFSGSAKEVRI